MEFFWRYCRNQRILKTQKLSLRAAGRHTGVVEVQLQPFWTSTLDGSEWTTLAPAPFTTGEIAQSNHYQSVTLTRSVSLEEEQNLLSPTRIELQNVQPNATELPRLSKELHDRLSVGPGSNRAPTELKQSKAIPLQACSGPVGSRNLRFPDFMTTAQDGGKVVSLTHRPPIPPGNTAGTHFC
jgi:hypothetical protein